MSWFLRLKSGCCDDPLVDLLDSAVSAPPSGSGPVAWWGSGSEWGTQDGTELCRAEILSRKMPCAGRISLEERHLLVDIHHARLKFGFSEDHTKCACLYWVGRCQSRRALLPDISNNPKHKSVVGRKCLVKSQICLPI